MTLAALQPEAIMEPIFFDFESDRERKIYFLAFQMDDYTVQYVCEKTLGSIAIKNALKVADAETACAELLALREKNRRPIACYSSHDATVLGGTKPNTNLTYFNMRRLAKSRINKNHYKEYRREPVFNRGIRARGRAVDRWAFVSIATWAGINPPPMYARGETLERIRAVISGLKRTRGLRRTDAHAKEQMAASY
jgi:hypothetical protein